MMSTRSRDNGLLQRTMIEKALDYKYFGICTDETSEYYTENFTLPPTITN